MPLYYYSNIMQYAQVSVKFPADLNNEIEQFIEETGLYTNRSEFVKDASRRLLQEYNNDVGVAALRLEKLLARAERDRRPDEEIRAELKEIRATIGDRLEPADVEEAVDQSRGRTSRRFHGLRSPPANRDADTDANDKSTDEDRDASRDAD